MAPPPPWKNQRIKGADIAWAPKMISEIALPGLGNTKIFCEPSPCFVDTLRGGVSVGAVGAIAPTFF